MIYLNQIYFKGVEVLFLIIVTLLGVLSSVIFHFPLVLGFLPGFLVLVVLAYSKRIPSKEILRICTKGVYKTKIVLIILFLVSFLLPSWYLSGTINQMVSLALHLITVKHFLVLSFIAAIFFSMILGTSIGTLSSIGVPIISTAIVLHFPIKIVAGALVSGSFVGDRSSPFSSSHQLLAGTLELPIKKQGKAMLFTAVLAIAVCLGFYFFKDASLFSTIHHHMDNMMWVKLSLIKFLPPILLIIFVLFRLSIIYAFLASILSACMIAMVNGTSFTKIMVDFWSGIHGLGGGLSNMYELLLFLMLAGAYNGLLEEMNVIQPYLNSWLQSSKTLYGDTFKTILATLMISMISANQTLPIILTGRSFLPHWSSKYGKEELARVMGDSTMLFPGILPWSVFAIMCSSIVGVPLLDYLPYAVFPLVLPFITFVISLFKQLKGFNKEKSSAA